MYRVTLETHLGKKYELDVEIMDGSILQDRYYPTQHGTYFDDSVVRLYSVKSGRLLSDFAKTYLTSWDWNSIMLQIQGIIADGDY